MRIMLVDDEADLLDTMGTILEINGYDVIKVTDGADVVPSAIMEQPNLILLDVMLPHRTGWSVCKELHDNALTVDIPIVMVSARSQQEDVEKGLQAGAKDYLIKPFMIEELLAVISRWAKGEDSMAK
ncbi:MAG TPA: response regulator transcription factor [Bacillota bacterium]|nr:response regulator transcription factor [Bacillota bacterium]